MKILFVCSAGDIPEIGTGHFVRLFAVANQIKASWASVACLEIHFIGHLDGKYVNNLINSGFVYFSPGNANISLYELIKTINLNYYDVIVFDVLDTNLDSVTSEASVTPVIITIDNFDESSAVDLRLFSTRNSLSESKSLNLVFFPETNYSMPDKLHGSGEFVVFCSFGGFDSNSISFGLLDYLIGIDLDSKIRWKFMVANPDSLLRRYGNSIPSSIEILDKSANFLMELGSSDLALVSGGLTMYQSLFLGRPSLVVPQYNHQNESAVRMQDKGACLIFKHSKDESGFSGLLEAVIDLKDAPERLRRLSLNARLAVSENSLSRIAEICTLYEFLDWDSDFFGFPIARIHTPVLSKRILDFVLEKAESDHIRCIYYLDSGQNFESLKLAQENNFSLVDTRITLEKRLDIAGEDVVRTTSCRLATLLDSRELDEMAGDAYLKSRYFFDKNFDPYKCELFYKEWLRKSISGHLDDYVLVYEVNGKIAGFTTVKEIQNVATIGLIGVKEEFRGIGVGKKLMQGVETFLSNSDIPLVRVVTQGRNIAAQRLYSSCGYLPVNNEYWLHRWESS